MPFENDVFISYAHLDNQPLAEGLKGWVETLHERLRVRLTQMLGEEVSVWRDPKLGGNDVFGETLIARLSNAALLVAIISPRYVKSDWCRRELDRFCENAEKTIGLRTGDKLRAFKVVKFYVPREEHPPQLSGTLGYEFYEYDPARGRSREFSPEVSPQRDIRYWERLDDLAWDIKTTLELLREGATEGAAARTQDLVPEKTVYLAESTGDVGGARDALRRELQQRGYAVLPDEELPLRVPELLDAVRGHLSRCALSVHLVGESYGIVPEGEEERSIVRLQEELAAERAAADPSFSRIVWMPVGLQPAGSRQQAYVEELHTKIAAGTELLQTTNEDLKTRVFEKLSPQQKAASEDETGAESVYLICDNRDAAGVAPIEDYLFKEGYEVFTSAVEGDSEQLAQFHRESLLNCDAALVHYGSGNQLWLRSKLWDLQKAKGWGRTKPMRARAVYVSGPATPEKQRFRTHEVPLVVQNFGEFSPDALRPFVSALRAGDGGRP